VANWTPTDKLAATGATGAAVLVLVWALSLLGVDVPDKVQLALAVLLPWLAGWLKTERHALAALLTTKRGRRARH